jgi:hypothetical protein
MAFPCVFTGHEFDGPLSCRTDGVWVWWDDLSHYLKEHHLVIPGEMLHNIQANDYETPSVTLEQILRLEWPPVS